MSGRRRFYTAAAATPDGGVSLDGRPVRTPGKALLVLPGRRLAEAVAAEWAAQGETIDPETMPLTRLANTAIDRVQPERRRIEAEIRDYAGSDLVCYRATRPPDLVALQSHRWDPVLDWARTDLDAPLVTVAGLIHRPQPEAALAAAAGAVAAIDSFTLTGLHNIMTLTGSALLALMIGRKAIDPAAAWDAAHVDEDYQISQWGEDAEAAVRRGRRRTEFLSCCRFMELARSQMIS